MGTNDQKSPVVQNLDIKKKQRLKSRLTKDLCTAEDQYKSVLKRLDELNLNQQILLKQKLALETLVNYLKAVLH